MIAPPCMARALPARHVWSLVMLGAGLGCSSNQGQKLVLDREREHVLAPREAGLVSPAALFASTEPDTASVSRVEPDGRRLLVSRGMRMIQYRDGSLERASELLPAKENVRVTPLPIRLGGGYLFHVASRDTTLIWFAREFIGKLTPLANLSFAVENIVPGFDRLYLLGVRSPVPLAIDAETGNALDLGPLPPSPGYEALAFRDAWMGAVAVPLRGVLASFDAGSSWHPVPGASKLTATELGPMLKTENGWGILTNEGELAPYDAPEAEAQKLDQLLETVGDRDLERAQSSEPVPRPRTPERPLGRDPLRVAILHGVQGPKGTAYAAHLGTLAKVRLSDGKLLQLATQRFPANASCHGIRLFEGYGFVCSQERGKTSIYALELPLSLRSVFSFNEPRYVSDTEHGGLVIRGRCDPDQAFDASYYCLITKHGQRELKVRGDVGTERVALFEDGSAAVIVPPRKGASATLTRVDTRGQSRQQKLKLPASGPGSKLLKDGIWLEGMSPNAAGEIMGWVAGSGPFVGVRIKPNGEIENGEVQNDIERALISGRFALVESQYGRALQTTNGGFDWLEVATLEGPTESDSEGPARAEQGCSALGCATSHWLRVGWTESEERDKPLEATPPERTIPKSPGGGRWTMHCRATGEASPRALPTESAERAHERARMSTLTLGGTPSLGATLESTAWQPFFELGPPNLTVRQLGFDLFVEYGNDKLHAYAYGQRGADWDRTGKLVLRALDRFQVKGGVWSSEVTRSPWPDELSAAAAFGEGMSGGSANWQFESEPSGREGLLLVRQPSTTELFIVAEGRAVTPIRGADIVTRTAGVVRIGSTWHLGVPTSDGFAVFKIVGDRLQLLASYPFDESSSGQHLAPRLVRNTQADALAILLEGVGKHLYPIHLVDGALESPRTIAPSEYSRLPPACTEDDSGYLLMDSVRVAPFVELMGEASAVSASRVEARLVASARGICADVLAAQASAVLPESLARGGKRGVSPGTGVPVPMVLSEQGQASRRWLFDCYP